MSWMPQVDAAGAGSAVVLGALAVGAGRSPRLRLLGAVCLQLGAWAWISAALPVGWPLLLLALPASLLTWGFGGNRLWRATEGAIRLLVLPAWVLGPMAACLWGPYVDDWRALQGEVRGLDVPDPEGALVLWRAVTLGLLAVAGLGIGWGGTTAREAPTEALPLEVTGHGVRVRVRGGPWSAAQWPAAALAALSIGATVVWWVVGLDGGLQVVRGIAIVLFGLPLLLGITAVPLLALGLPSLVIAAMGDPKALRSFGPLVAFAWGVVVTGVAAGAEDVPSVRVVALAVLAVHGVEALARLASAGLRAGVAHEVELSPGRAEVVVWLAGRLRGPPWSAPLEEPPALGARTWVIAGRAMPAVGVSEADRAQLEAHALELVVARAEVVAPSALTALLPRGPRGAGLADWAWEAVTALAVGGRFAVLVRLAGAPLVVLALAKLDRVLDFGLGEGMVREAAAVWLGWTLWRLWADR